jgi:hypothetical protein
VPGEIYAREYSLYRPSSQVSNQLLSSLSNIQFNVSNPSMYLDLYNSFISIKASVVDSGGNAYTNEVIAPELGMMPFGVAQLMVGTTSIESTSSLLNETTYIHRLMSYSKDAKDTLGVASLLSPEYPIGAVPANQTTYPPADNGSQSISVAPALVTSVSTAVESPALTVAGGTPGDPGAVTGIIPAGGAATQVTVATTTTSTAAINETYSESFAYRCQISKNSRNFTFQVRLADILSFVQPSTPVLFGQTIQLTLQPAQGFKLFRSATATTSTLKISDMSLWLRNVVPSSIVAARLAEDSRAQRKALYQYLARDSLLFSNNSKSFSQSFTIPLSNPQWVVLRFLPSTFTSEQNCAYQCSLVPSPVVNNFPFSSAYLTYNGDVIPQTSWGSSPSDLVRAYTAFLECAGAVDPMGSGASISYADFIANHFVLCFYLGNRKVQQGPAGSMAGSITLQLTCTGTPSNTYNVIASYYGVKGVQVEAGGQGLSLVNIS